MLPLITERRSEIAALCRRFGVRRLAVFGSAARSTDFDPQCSDIDFVVAFERDDGASLNDFLALRDALATTVNRPVDLVMEGSVRNPFIQAGIQRSAEIVYGS
jgi:predicted nucleotidyltransferase